jgi:hypothetical protein
MPLILKKSFNVILYGGEPLIKISMKDKNYDCGFPPCQGYGGQGGMQNEAHEFSSKSPFEGRFRGMQQH